MFMSEIVLCFSVLTQSLFSFGIWSFSLIHELSLFLFRSNSTLAPIPSASWLPKDLTLANSPSLPYINNFFLSTISLIILISIQKWCNASYRESTLLWPHIHLQQLPCFFALHDSKTYWKIYLWSPASFPSFSWIHFILFYSIIILLLFF